MDWGGDGQKDPPNWVLWVLVILATLVLIFIFM